MKTLNHLLKRLLSDERYEALKDTYLRHRLSSENYYAYRKQLYDEYYNGSVIEVDGYRFRLHRHEAVSRFFFMHRTFDRPVTEVLLRAARRCQTFIDIGANIGLITVPIACQSGKSTLAIEPVQTNFDLLSENVRLNGLTALVQVQQVALGEKPDTLNIYLSPNNAGDHRLTLHQTEHRDKVESVRVVPLDTCIQTTGLTTPPFLIKIDVQGYECQVLKGATNVLHAPCFVVSEFWPWGLAAAGSSPEEFEALRRSAALNVYEIVTHAETKLQQLSDLTDLVGRIGPQWDEHADVVLTNIDLADMGLQDLVAWKRGV